MLLLKLEVFVRIVTYSLSFLMSYIWAYFLWVIFEHNWISRTWYELLFLWNYQCFVSFFFFFAI